jgi:hypothetical protein
MKVFPVILIILDIGASIVYGYNKDYARAWYWLMAAGITASTLFIRG